MLLFFFFKKKIVHLVKKADGKVGINLTSDENGEIPTVDNNIINNVGNFVIMDCEDGICEQINGYVKDSNNNVYAFIDNKVGKLVSDGITDENNCGNGTGGTNNIGKFIANGGGICINKRKKVEFKKESKENDKFIIFNDTPAMENTPFRDTENTILIKNHPNYIINNMFCNGGT